jgi:large subunit ribosomal protein L10
VILEMGRTLENKKEIVEDLKQMLSESQLALVIDYKGLTVAEIAELRGRLRESGAVCKITKNTLMRIATEEDEAWNPIGQFLQGASAFLLLKDDLGKGIKAYQAFQKDTKKTELRGGVMEGRALNEDDIKAITELPTKEELIARIAGAINAVPTKLAVGTKAVPTKLAVGIKEVPNSLVRAIDAIAKKEDADAA